jgi:hypothetical protein
MQFSILPCPDLLFHVTSQWRSWIFKTAAGVLKFDELIRLYIIEAALNAYTGLGYSPTILD